MPPGVRRLAWGSFLAIAVGLVAAATAYVGIGTRDFWLVTGAAAVALVAYVITVFTAPMPTLGDASRDSQRWYWF